jgi:hypothetical protein
MAMIKFDGTSNAPMVFETRKNKVNLYRSRRAEARPDTFVPGYTARPVRPETAGLIEPPNHIFLCRVDQLIFQYDTHLASEKVEQDCGAILAADRLI